MAVDTRPKGAEFYLTRIADKLIDGQLDVSSAVPAAPTQYTVTLTSANTQYSQAMPTNCRAFEFQCRTAGAEVRFAFVTGKVAGSTDPYGTLKAGNSWYSPALDQGAAPSTLYFASGTAGAVVEVIAWV